LQVTNVAFKSDVQLGLIGCYALTLDRLVSFAVWLATGAKGLWRVVTIFVGKKVERLDDAVHNKRNPQRP
jgi:hypothetical protein